jgi:mannose-6-phosphate isomerase-like protein (cupin superfamily)
VIDRAVKTCNGLIQQFGFREQMTNEPGSEENIAMSLNTVPGYNLTMPPTPFSASGKSFSVHEWRGSGPATLHVHHSDDEAWHVLDGELTFRYADRTENVGPGTTVFVPAGMPHLHGGNRCRYLIVLTPRIAALISALQTDRHPAHQHDIYRRFDSELLE